MNLRFGDFMRGECDYQSDIASSPGVSQPGALEHIIGRDKMDVQPNNYNKLNIVVFTLFLLFFGYSCILSPGIKIDLIEKKVLSDTTIFVGDTLSFDLREYFELSGNYTGRKTPSYPEITPFIEDTSIIKINYDYKNDVNGKDFSLISKKEGITTILLNICWSDCDNTEWREVKRSFILSVIERE